MNWSLLHGFSEVEICIQGRSIIVPTHVKRKYNSVVDYLENMAFAQGPRESRWFWWEVGMSELRENVT
jgi:hypothetical protein